MNKIPQRLKLFRNNYISYLSTFTVYFVPFELSPMLTLLQRSPRKMKCMSNFKGGNLFLIRPKLARFLENQHFGNRVALVSHVSYSFIFISINRNIIRCDISLYIRVFGRAPSRSLGLLDTRGSFAFPVVDKRPSFFVIDYTGGF